MSSTLICFSNMPNCRLSDSRCRRDKLHQCPRIAAIDTGRETRPTVFRKVIEHEQYKEALYNPTFVLMQYYGYLRREPDGTGYNFWLGQLNRFPLYDLEAAHAMVCSFITSVEYQNRFGSIITHSNAECPQ
jgi:hypothetical protein